MFKKILVISDNVNLCKEFEQIIFDLNLRDLDWSFSVSPYSNLTSFEELLQHKVFTVDLKQESEVQLLCETYDLIFSIHCKQIFPKILVETIKCINIHPGYNPINRGWYPQVFAIINQTRVGATIHEIDAQLDHGNIIDQDFVSIDSWDTSLSLYKKITNLEITLLRNNIKAILHNSYTTTVPSSEGNLYLKKDFNALCTIDLNKEQTIRETINLLRALTHGEYKNAFYVDELNGKKIYLSIDFQEWK